MMPIWCPIGPACAGESTLARRLLEAIEAHGRATPPVLVSTDALVKSVGAETGIEAYRRPGPLTEPMGDQRQLSCPAPTTRMAASADVVFDRTI